MRTVSETSGTTLNTPTLEIYGSPKKKRKRKGGREGGRRKNYFLIKFSLLKDPENLFPERKKIKRKGKE